MYLIITLAAGVLLFFLLKFRKTVKPVVNITEEEAEAILKQRVAYFRTLSTSERQRFKEEVIQFLGHVRITGVKTEVTHSDSVLVAASAVIPIFAFPGWQYPNLNEVLLYPDNFDEKFDLSKENKERVVLGMVGSGPMNQTMILSKPSLHAGFDNKTDKNNTAIHEFVHLIDKTDGDVDGVPDLLLDKKLITPWLSLMHKHISNIKNDNSDINPYAATNEAEFFAVASEYFFERPLLLEEKHPQLFALLESVFKQQPQTDSNKFTSKNN